MQDMQCKKILKIYLSGLCITDKTHASGVFRGGQGGQLPRQHFFGGQ